MSALPYLDLCDARTALAAKDARIAELERQVADAERAGMERGLLLAAVKDAPAKARDAIMRAHVDAAMPAAAKDEVRHG